MKRYAIVEVPEMAFESSSWFCPSIHFANTLLGPVELIQAATKEAGVVWSKPKKGEWYFTSRWIQEQGDFDNTFFPVIPGPEPEKPCQNCQGAESKDKINRMWNKEGTEILCFECGRPESEWTYAKDRWKSASPSPSPSVSPSASESASPSVSPSTSPCQNCQGIEHGKFVEAYVTMFFKEPKCMKCGKFKSEWTYKNARSHEPGGIGCGGTGGPI